MIDDRRRFAGNPESRRPQTQARSQGIALRHYRLRFFGQVIDALEQREQFGALGFARLA